MKRDAERMEREERRPDPCVSSTRLAADILARAEERDLEEHRTAPHFATLLTLELRKAFDENDFGPRRRTQTFVCTILSADLNDKSSYLQRLGYSCTDHAFSRSWSLRSGGSHKTNWWPIRSVN